MTSGYLVRLICLCFACFFLVHTVVGALVLFVVPPALRRAQGMRARTAARFLLLLRLAPLFAALLVVTALCVPSYLWFEPRGQEEAVGIFCFAAAAMGIVQWIVAVFRASVATVRTLAFGRKCRRLGICLRIEGQRAPVLIVDGTSPLLALSGVFRPALFLSRGVFHSLPPEELQAALCHEDAHRRSRDNGKRLALLLAPELLPLGRHFAVLEREWARLCEWAADDEAAAGDPRRALALASALVRVARMGAPVQPQLAIPLTECGCGLEARVARLLCNASLGDAPAARSPWPRHVDLLFAGVLATLLLFLPGALAAIHGILERLVR